MMDGNVPALNRRESFVEPSGDDTCGLCLKKKLSELPCVVFSSATSSPSRDVKCFTAAIRCAFMSASSKLLFSSTTSDHFSFMLHCPN